MADWRAGDQLVVAPSGYDPGESEVQTIASISAGTCDSTITLTTASYSPRDRV